MYMKFTQLLLIMFDLQYLKKIKELMLMIVETLVRFKG